MTDRESTICSLLCKYGRAEVLKDFNHDSCIASTRVAIEVLRHFNISSIPMSTKKVVGQLE
jgi:hypothetical protein